MAIRSVILNGGVKTTVKSTLAHASEVFYVQNHLQASLRGGVNAYTIENRLSVGADYLPSVGDPGSGVKTTVKPTLAHASEVFYVQNHLQASLRGGVNAYTIENRLSVGADYLPSVGDPEWGVKTTFKPTLANASEVFYVQNHLQASLRGGVNAYAIENRLSVGADYLPSVGDPEWGVKTTVKPTLTHASEVFYVQNHLQASLRGGVNAYAIENRLSVGADYLPSVGDPEWGVKTTVKPTLAHASEVFYVQNHLQASLRGFGHKKPIDLHRWV